MAFSGFSLLLLASLATALQYWGVSEAGMEFGISPSGPNGPIPGTPGVNYFAPSPQAMKNAAQEFANFFRIPVAWERLQPTLNGPLDNAYLQLLDGAISAANSVGAVASIDVHNYAKYQGQVIGSGTSPDAFGNLWTQLSNRYKSNPQVWFDIMNEPSGIDTTVWWNAAQVAVNAIRATGASNTILVSGNCYTRAHDWVSGNCDVGGTPNGKVALSLKDPGSNIVFEMHQYFDSDFSGTSPDCVHGVEQLSDATNWLRANGKKGFLGEWAVGNTGSCQSVGSAVATFLNQNSDVWIGATWWAAGSAWGTYLFSVEDSNGSGNVPDTVGLELLKQFKSGGGVSSSGPSVQTTTAVVQSTQLPLVTSSSGSSGGSCAPVYGQCGGNNWAGPTCCTASKCTVGNPWYSQCLP